MKKYLSLLLLSLCIVSHLSGMESGEKSIEKYVGSKGVLRLLCLNDQKELDVEIEVTPDFRDWCKTIQHMLNDLEEMAVGAIPVMVPATSLSLLKEFHTIDTQEAFLQGKNVDELVALFKAMTFLDYKNPNTSPEHYKELRFTLDQLTEKITSKQQLKKIFEKTHKLDLAGDHEALVRECLIKKCKPLLIDYCLLNGTKVSLKTIPGYDSDHYHVDCLMTPDDRKLLIASGSVIQVWDMEKEVFLPSLTCTGPVYALSVSPDSKTLLVGSENYAELWDLETSTYLRILEHEGIIKSVCFNADGCVAFTGSSNMSDVKVWDTKEGIVVKTLPINGGICSLSVTGDGTYVIVGYESNHRGYITIWNLDTEESLSGEVGIWPMVCISPDNKKIIMGNFYGNVSVWDIESGGCLKSFSVSSYNILSVMALPDGKKILTAVRNCAKIWDIETKECLRAIPLCSELKATLTRNFTESICFSSDGNTIITGSCKTVTIRDLYDVELERSLKNSTLHQALLLYYSLKHTEGAREFLSSSTAESIIRSMDSNLQQLVKKQTGKGAGAVNCVLS